LTSTISITKYYAVTNPDTTLSVKPKERFFKVHSLENKAEKHSAFWCSSWKYKLF